MVIELEKIFNARDLGGMKAADGKHIAPRRLIRSSALGKASQSDIDILTKTYNLRHVVDFRTEDERLENPHLTDKYPNVEYHFLCSFDKIKEVVTRDKKSNYLLIKRVENLTVEKAINIIEDFYDQLPTVPSLQKAYSDFFEILLNNEKGSTLWHCSLGKDRAGIAAVLVEYCLGVSMNDILADYLLTNEHLSDDIKRSKDNAFRIFYGVRESFFEAWINSIKENYGSIDSYLEKALNLNDSKIKKLREMYLE